MTLEPLLGSTALYRADVSWNTFSELSALTSLAQLGKTNVWQHDAAL